MLSNIIDIDFQAMTVSLKCEKGAMFFFDFKAAFPSVAHSFLKRSLHMIGVPACALSFIDSIYSENHCDIAFKGNKYEGFGMHAGVRQGCPISPLLFAAAIDVLIRRLQQKMPSSTIRAFADDIGLVVENWSRDHSIAQGVFQEFAVMSGLELNIPKTVCIPLWPGGKEEVKNNTTHIQSAWGGVKISGCGTYLGFSSGPEKGDSSWDKPLAKYVKRAAKWKLIGAGAQFATAAYNALALSTLLYIAQLETPPPKVLEAETRCIRGMLGGPGNWYQPRDAFFLKEAFGQNKSYGSVELISQAAKLRVRHSHRCIGQGGRVMNTSSISRMHTTLHQALSNPVVPWRVSAWQNWYDRSHVTILYDNEVNIDRLGLSMDMCLVRIAGGEQRPWNDKTRAKQKREFQKTVTAFLKESCKFNAVERVRDKLHRWMDEDAASPTARSVRMLITGLPRQVAERVTKRLQRLPKLVPPRVGSAAFRTLSNGWCTDRRFQGHGTCRLGCNPNAGDSIEHYCRCPITRELFRKKLRFEMQPTNGLAVFAMAMKQQEEDEVLALTMLGVYAVYMCTNHYRHNPSKVNSRHALDYLGQCLIQGCRGHRELTRLLDGRWESPIIRLE